MRIKDITHADVRAGRNWRVLNPDAQLQDGFHTEELEIEPLDKYAPSDTLVYSGVSVYLKVLGEPRTGLLDRLLGRGKRRQECRFPPDDPNELQPEATPIVRPLLTVKEVQESGWGYCEYVNGAWRQLGLKPNPDAPLTTSYFADPVEDDTEFDICGDDMPLRELNKEGFRSWVSYMTD